MTETSALRAVRHIENILMKSNQFYLPKKTPQNTGIDWEVVVIDATEIPIQRPKRTKEVL